MSDETVALLAAAKVKKDSKQLKTSKKELELLNKQICEAVSAVSVGTLGVPYLGYTWGKLRGTLRVQFGLQLGYNWGTVITVDGCGDCQLPASFKKIFWFAHGNLL